jgi:D-xylose reductase
MESTTQTTSSFTLTSGDKMPSVGLGLWKIPNDLCSQVV